jgi:hypothetical protein
MAAFYVFQNTDDIEKWTTHYHPIDGKSGPGAQCENCGLAVGSLTWLPPYRVELELWGESFADVAFSGASDLLISERFKHIYQTARLQGVKGFEPVEIVKVKFRKRKHKAQPPKYFHVSILRDSARVDDQLSGLEREEPSTCLECGSSGAVKYQRISLVEGTWSGLDVFYARGLPGIILVSNRFEESYRINKITGGVLIPVEIRSYDRNDFSWMEKYK